MVCAQGSKVVCVHSNTEIIAFVNNPTWRNGFVCDETSAAHAMHDPRHISHKIDLSAIVEFWYLWRLVICNAIFLIWDFMTEGNASLNLCSLQRWAAWMPSSHNVQVAVTVWISLIAVIIKFTATFASLPKVCGVDLAAIELSIDVAQSRPRLVASAILIYLHLCIASVQS